MNSNKQIYGKLCIIFGKSGVFNELIDRTQYAYDATQKRFVPDFVVFPKNAQQISELFKLADKEQMPIVPRGAGSGFTGGALASNGGIVVSTELMNKIESIDTTDLTAVVEPGVINYLFQQEVEKKGLFYPPDPASWQFSTLGGNVAENAGGPRAVKYGVTKDYILGLEAVLPNGDFIRAGSRNIKDVVGYNIAGLLIGSEGTLAFITKIIIKLIPKPQATATVLAEFKTLAGAVSSVPLILNNNILPTAIEFMDKYSVNAVKRYTDISISKSTEAILVIQTDGSKTEASSEAKKISELLCAKAGAAVKVATDKAEEDFLWRARRSVSPSLKNIRPNKMNEDIVVPRNRLDEMVEKTDHISKKYGLPIVNFGHAGDGNIHVNVLYENGQREKAESAVYEIFESVVELGGTLSGEHGIGMAKQKFLKLAKTESEINIMKSIKHAFDPNNILNPGKTGL
ncbi:MAG: FAD-binding protein [Epsilonproteobacteria bacterium]|nr:FAD-binding protein [Campylobacterota bacterium]